MRPSISNPHLQAIRTVAIVLGDNDFGNTFMPLLRTIFAAISSQPDIDREKIATLVREGVRFHYIAFQLRDPEAPAEIEKTTSYLQKATVLFDEEAEADILTKDHNYGAWYLNAGSGSIGSY